jgi:YD repeat-containing protein
LREESATTNNTESHSYLYATGGNPPISYFYSTPPPKTMSSTYHLTKTKDINSDDSIQFNYNNRAVMQVGGYNEVIEYHENDDPEQLAAGIQTNAKRSSATYSYQYTGTNSKQISSIVLPDKKTLHFYYDKKREDLQGDSALTRIEVKDGFGNSKKYRLRYSYFDASNVVANPNANVANWWNSYGSLSGYENKPEFFTHRLRLDNIQSVTDWENGDSLLISEFVYNDTILPPRSSRAIDYWGYYYGPHRYVNTTVPEIAPYTNMDLSVEGVIAPTIPSIRLNDYCNGSNRMPDPFYTRASVLKQIKLPTGGNTSFNLETNTIKGPIYHNSNKENTSLNTQIRKRAAAIPDQSFLMPCRAQTSVLFYAKVKRVNNDGSIYVPPPPSQQATCFENAVGDSRISFCVKSTDGTVTKQVLISAVEVGEVEMYPVHFILPLGKEYVLYYTYDRTQAPCLEEACFNITTRVVYTTDKNIDYVGGLRVANIQHYDPMNNQTLKTVYNYDADGAPQGSCNNYYPSSLLPSIPNFNSGAVRAMGKWLDRGGLQMPLFMGYATYKSRSSNSTQTLGYTGGSNVGYTKVTVSKVNHLNQSLGKTLTYFSGVDLKNEYTIYPYKVNQIVDWNSGQTLKEQVYDNTNKLLKQTDYSYYTPVQVYDNDKNKSIKIVNIRSDNKAEEVHAQIFFNRYLATSYYPYYGKSFLRKKTETDFVNNESMVTETNYSYYGFTSHIAAITSKNSKGEKVVSNNYYPQDFTNAAIQQLVTNKVTGTPVASKTIMPGQLIGGISAEREISGSGVDYEIQFGNKVRPKLFYEMATDNPLTVTPFNPAQVKQANDVLVGEVTLYDAYGNACEYKGRDAVVQTIIWGYNYTLPVAKVTGIGYLAALAQMTSINIDNLQQITDDATLRSKINEIRQANVSNPNVQVSTITYKPLIGVTSETDASGRTVYYEYDAFHRLKLVRDKDQNIIKRYDYKYQATPNY